MSHTETIFKKDISELKIEDLTSYFETEQEETSIIEFKSGRVEINDIFKEITAFLNTEGGILIIGAPIEQKRKIGKNTQVFCVGDLTYSSFRNKDWLYQKIASNISPSPTDLKIFEHLEKNGTIFLIDIPQSRTPPHQASSDGRYYIRLEREAKPAPHGIIQALFQKRRSPKLNSRITINQFSDDIDKLDIAIFNNSPIPANNVSYIVDIYNIIEMNEDPGFNKIQEAKHHKFSYNRHTGHSLVQLISIPLNFSLRHGNKPYVVMVGYWCQDLDFDYKFWTYDPLKKVFLVEGSSESEILISDQIDSLFEK